MLEDDVRQAILSSDAVLGKYSPLERILSVDNFDDGQHGWTGYDCHDPSASTHHRVGRTPPDNARSVPQLSNLPMWDVGTYGSWDTYALKIPTLPRAGHRGVAVKRPVSSWYKKLRVEAYFTYAADPSDFRFGETDVHSFFISFRIDDQVRNQRWTPAVRYLNSVDGALVQKWQAMYEGSWGDADERWDDLTSGHQKLGFNRSPTKFQWHYVRLTFDLERNQYCDFNCYGKEFPVDDRPFAVNHPPEWSPLIEGRHGSLVSPAFAVEARNDKRCYLYLDSVVVSARET